MSEKKVIGRNVAIALGLTCIVLAVGLVGAVASYTSIISGKDNTIASLNSQITSKDFEISSLNSQKASLENQIDSLNDIVHLAKSEIWLDSETISQPANSYWYFSTNKAIYAGYVSVAIHTSTTTNTYVRLNYSVYVTTSIVDGHVYVTALNYDNRIDVGSSGTAVFPVLPASSIEIRIATQTSVVEQPKRFQ